MPADEIAHSGDPGDAQAALEKSRDAAARLMESLARRIGASQAVRGASAGFERAARCVPVRSMKDAALAVQRIVRRRPVYSIGAAVAVGFLVGRWVRSR
jgi:ElaB/YqjD/DUF883 family membrane-anchored ribosome-binding protein